MSQIDSTESDGHLGGAGDYQTDNASASLATGSYWINWMNMPSPATGTVTVSMPSGTTVTSVVDEVTRQPVSYAVSGSTVTYALSDDPVGLMADPVSTATATPIPCVIGVPCGSFGHMGR